MGRGRVARVMVRRFDGDARRLQPDEVIVEEPMELRLDGHLVTTTMRTPGHDFELAAGYCHSEGLLGDGAIRTIRYCATGSAVATEFNVVTVETERGDRHPPARLATTSSSCGLCGSQAIEDLRSRLTPLSSGPGPVGVVDHRVVAGVAGAVRDQQSLFGRTGSVHAAAAFALDDGAAVVVREDIGRHNAADKVIGRLLLDGRLPADGLGLYLSGRVSLEMVQKAWAAGFRVVVSVGGPSSLAIETAQAANITLVAFTRDATMNVYSGAVT